MRPTTLTPYSPTNSRHKPSTESPTEEEVGEGSQREEVQGKGKKAVVEEDSPKGIPLESCRVVEAGDKDIMTYYLIGAHALVKE